ncbi:MAG TPA: galactose-1-phosphate uridylyltransferase [Methylomirabilota bacterium]|nr:galactose-1-phosphate uridylyltransferase [Methylomirabilota bacterium]
MPELRRDPIVGRWVIISTERSRRPSDFVPAPRRRKGGPCVFCEGQEYRTPEEVWALRPGRGEPNTPGWLLRVVPNKFPALRIEGELEPSAEGMFDRMNGIGAHEVIIESPEHDAVIEQLPVSHLAEVFRAYRDRINDLAKDPRLEYVMVFKNHGDPAGASLEHTHSQLIATPVVPLMVEEELAGALQHLKLRQRCIWCDIIRQERQARTRIVFEHDGFVALAPFAPRFPFETWVLPTAHRSRYEETPAEALTALATVVARVLGRMRTFLEDPPYNLMLHSAPLRRPALDQFHWHLEIIPKLTRVAGFEWGTGFFINPTPPEEAAKYLRGETPEPPVS